MLLLSFKKLCKIICCVVSFNTSVSGIILSDSCCAISVDVQALYYIAIAEGSKTYLSKDVDNHNKDFLFKPYKDLCGRIALLFKEYNPKYKFPASLASTLVETAHMQDNFMQHLPSLGDYSKKKNPKEIEAFLEQLVFGALDAKYKIIN